ncbi:hypothetical protein RNT41_05220 [Staphylococcus pseudintermedius]|uniref:phage lytic cycle repressor MrpR family protein n=1 Tax=Staphylococcus pseudintermedius TaxID=283734 RepID=UPI002885FCC9|nr:hypothetical protein [Staphylococcus pseudintermedius]MDT0939348.1 hypothetical protein [Staphylococcus pseudintermedius]
MFYNSLYKKQFLQSLERENEIRVYTALFNNSSKVEQQFDTDLYNFTTTEIEILLYNIYSSSKNTLLTYLTFAKKYTDYAIERGDRLSNINLFRMFTYDKIDKFVYKHKQKFFTYEKFLLHVSSFYNASDRALISAIFHGISGTAYSELINLTIEDIKEARNNPTYIVNNEQYYKLKLSNDKKSETIERYVEVPELLLDDMESSYKATIYYTKNGDPSSRTPAKEVISGNHIFRNIEFTDTTTEQIDKQVVYRRIRVLQDLTNNYISSVTNVIDSGILHYMYLLSENGKLDFIKIEKVMRRYNRHIFKNSLSYTVARFSEQYTDALQELYGVVIVNKP